VTETASPEPLLRVTELSTGYGDLRVVWDVSFEVRAGEITVLLGRNGAGKTTTIRAIAGLNKVARGDVLVQGRSVVRTSAHERVRLGMAYVQEGKRVFRSQTIEQNLLLGGYTLKKKRGELREDIERVYEMFPVLAEKRSQLASSMSGGQQQMLAIGQALMAKPQILLLDEPSGGLAPVIVNEVMGRVQELKQTGLGILLVEQAVEASFKIADHIAVLDMGRTVLSERASDVSDMSVLQNAYFSRASQPSA
jgi:branched-chain amino acid transport system ATP-binding protein